MTASSLLVNFRLEPSTPVRVHWLATDGTPTDGYKAQVVAILLGGARLAMDGSAILEQVVSDPLGGVNDFLVTFTGMVGFAPTHADRPHVEGIAADGSTIEYELTFVHAESGRIASEGTDYKVTDRPRATARKL